MGRLSMMQGGTHGVNTLILLLFFIIFVVVYYKHTSKDVTASKSSTLVFGSISPSMERKTTEKFKVLKVSKKPEYNTKNNYINETSTDKGTINFRSFMKQRYQAFPSGIGEDNVEKGDKYLIYRCDHYCGGWSDRIKGMQTAYLIANVTGRKFKSEFKDNGCNILDYVVPNLVNWSLPTSFHQTIPKKQSGNVSSLNLIDRFAFYNNIGNTNFSKLPQMQSKFVYFFGNHINFEGFKYSKIHPSHVSWMSTLRKDQISETLFRRLFKLSPRMQIKLDQFFNRTVPNPRDRLVCAHVRMGRNPTIPDDTSLRTRPKELPGVWKFLDQQAIRENTSIVFFSDSQNVVEEAKRQQFGKKVVSVPGNIVHIDKAKSFSTEQVCKGHEKLVLEQFIMMHCDVLMITESSFNRLPAYLRGSDRGLFCLVKGKVIPCKRQDIKGIYHTYDRR